MFGNVSLEVVLMPIHVPSSKLAIIGKTPLTPRRCFVSEGSLAYQEGRDETAEVRVGYRQRWKSIQMMICNCLPPCAEVRSLIVTILVSISISTDARCIECSGTAAAANKYHPCSLLVVVLFSSPFWPSLSVPVQSLPRVVSSPCSSFPHVSPLPIRFPLSVYCPAPILFLPRCHSFHV